jgi:predicted nucleic acid-binding protein
MVNLIKSNCDDNKNPRRREIAFVCRSTFINHLVLNSSQIEVTSSITECRDPKDNKFHELAVDGKAE